MCLLVSAARPSSQKNSTSVAAGYISKQISAVPLGRNSRNDCFRRRRHSAPALMEDRPSPTTSHNWTPTKEQAGIKQRVYAPAINFESRKCSFAKVNKKLPFLLPSIVAVVLFFMFFRTIASSDIYGAAAFISSAPAFRGAPRYSLFYS